MRVQAVLGLMTTLNDVWQVVGIYSVAEQGVQARQECPDWLKNKAKLRIRIDYNTSSFMDGGAQSTLFDPSSG